MLSKALISRSQLWLLLFTTILTNLCSAQSTYVKKILNGAVSDIVKVDSFYYGVLSIPFSFFKAKDDSVLIQKAFKDLPNSTFSASCENIFHVKENSQNYFLITGRTHNWVNSFPPPPTNYCAYVIKVNEWGDTLWSMLYERGSHFNFCLAPDSNYIFTQSAHGALIMKVDRNTGDTLWTKRYNYELPGYKWLQVFIGGVINNGNGYTVAGTMVPQNHSQLSLTRLDTAGNLLWNKTYGDTAINLSWGLTMTHDSGYVLIGQSAKDFADSYPWTNFMLVRTDANGDTLWCRTYDYNNGVDVPGGIVETDDYGFAVVGYSIKIDSATGNVVPKAIMIKVDSMGNVVWANNYSLEGYPISILKNETGFFFNQPYVNQTDTNGIDCLSQPITVTMHYPLMTVTDSMPFLDTLDASESYNALFYFHPHTEYDTVSIGTISDYCINTGVAEQQVNENDLLLYPNPVSDKLSVSIPISVGSQLTNSALLTVTIYDVLGKQKLQQPFAAYDGKLSLDVGDLSSGIYFLQVQQKGKVYNAKFVKE